MQRANGFTLIELMIVVVVIAILVAIAYPAYSSFLRESRRAQVKSLLLDFSLREERWRAEHPSYATTAELGVAAAIAAHPSARYYSVTITNVTAFDYVLTATAIGDQAADKQSGTSCTPLIVTKLTKTPAVCW